MSVSDLSAGPQTAINNTVCDALLPLLLMLETAAQQSGYKGKVLSPGLLDNALEIAPPGH